MRINMTLPIKKFGHTSGSVVQEISPDEFHNKLASDDILNRLNKFAQTIKAIAPRSDDFLYFSIIFLKSAEAALIDETGNLKKVGKDNAWGYFDEKWKWHGNVKPHKNNNGDIFPEAELKKATRNWIGRPLCVDHKSDTVDGVRGIILDTHYDEKLKQVVGLCALDKINYPDLARKVSTGVVRYGSMGTAVSTSICTECGKPATTPKEYCNHIMNRQAWGEINVGLNPIEYSLVVQPAEPGAILLRCFASIDKHKDELKSYGFDTETMMNTLDDNKANDLDLLLNSVCGPSGCSLDQRQRIVKGYLSTNGFTKSAGLKSAESRSELAKAMSDFASATGKTMEEAPELFSRFFKDELPFASEDVSSSLGETLTSGQNTSGIVDNGGVSDRSGTGSSVDSGLIAGVSEANPDSFSDEGDLVGRNVFTNQAEDNIKLSSILEEIMDETTLRKRAALRRRLAYPQGGAAPAAEPSTYKDEGALQKKIREQDDKHMHPNPTSLGGADGMAPGDKEKKTKLLRAQKALQNTKRAYHYGGAAPALEPSTFTSEDYHKYWDTDKHMHQTKPMGGDKGLFPGDEAIKQQQKRAKYEGPALSTKLKQLRAADGSVNKAASGFEVYSGDKLVIATTAKSIFGEKLEDNWAYLTSKEYAKNVIAAIRADGLEIVGQNLTRTAQELPEMPGMDAAAPADPMADPMAEMPEELPMEGAEAESEESPKAEIEDALIGMEDTIEQIRGALGNLDGGDVTTVNIGEGADVDMPEEQVALSKNIFNQLKVVLADAKDSADELALLAETYERYGKLSTAQRKDLSELSSGALRDYSSIVGSSKALVSVASTVSKSMVKVSEYVEEAKVVRPAPKAPRQDSLVASAMDLRKQRRQALLKKAQEKLEEMPEEACADDAEVEEKENEAHDGIGMKENAQVAGVASDTAQDIATKSPSGGDHKPAPSKGNQDANQHGSYSGTPSRQVAESGTPSPGQEHAADDFQGKEDLENKADDDEEVEEVAEEAAEEEVEEHEEDMHGKESDAQDALSAVQSKLNQSFIAKKAEDEREAYRVRLRRAYDVGMEMQRKAMLAKTRPALNNQVDLMMEFDDKAFEAFKRSVANAQGHSAVKVASDNGGINIGLTHEEDQTTVKTASDVNARSLATMWD
jgi:hypothetical protein